MIHHEIGLEDEMCDGFAARGARVGRGEAYDKDLALIPDELIEWLVVSGQLDEEPDGPTRDEIVAAAAKEIADAGAVEAFQSGFTYHGKVFELVQFQPAGTLNQKLRENYEANIFRVDRQVCYSKLNRNSIDIVAFMNGVPFFTAELKSSMTQSVEDAKTQYRKDRLPDGEPLLINTPVHFAISSDSIYSTTKLAGEKTRFFPFNDPTQDTVNYFWERVMTKTSALSILEHFFFEGKFPRFNQWEAATSAVAAFKQEGSGSRYLFEHSPGAGKTMTMSCLAHQLAFLHDELGDKMLDAVLVVTDRRILDSQMKKAIGAEAIEGTVEYITGSKAKEFKRAIQNGKRIIVITIQSFMHIDDELKRLLEVRNSKFAVLIDEAHSSQSGKYGDQLRSTLTGASEMVDRQDYFNEKVRRSKTDRISYFAFTATPKDETYQVFGREGKAFHTYSMKQAEQEKFIMPVLNRVYFPEGRGRLIIDCEEQADEEIPKLKGKRAIEKFIQGSDETLETKLRFAVNQYLSLVATQAGGQAKAMFACSSRENAARVKVIFDRLKGPERWPFEALTAFSGNLELDGETVNPADLNGFQGDIAQRFKENGYGLLITADMYQLGFDEPKLTALFIDKQLTEPTNIVQTYSRVNRICRGKKNTLIADFMNEPEVIFEAFNKYREGSLLVTGALSLEEIDRLIDALDLYAADDIARYVALISTKKKIVHSDITKIFSPLGEAFKRRVGENADNKATLVELNKAPGLLRRFSESYEIRTRELGGAVTVAMAQKHEFFFYLRQFLETKNRAREDYALDETISLESIKFFQKDDPVSLPGTDEGEGETSESEERTAAIRDLVNDINSRYPGSNAEDFINFTVYVAADDAGLKLQAANNERASFLDSTKLTRVVMQAAAEAAEEIPDSTQYLDELTADRVAEIGSVVYRELVQNQSPVRVA